MYRAATHAKYGPPHLVITETTYYSGEWGGKELADWFNAQPVPPPKQRRIVNSKDGMDPRSIDMTKFFMLAIIGKTDAMVTKRADEREIERAWRVFKEDLRPTQKDLTHAKWVLGVPGITHERFQVLSAEYKRMRGKRTERLAGDGRYQTYSDLTQYINMISYGIVGEERMPLEDTLGAQRLYPGLDTTDDAKREIWKNLYRTASSLVERKMDIQAYAKILRERNGAKSTKDTKECGS